MNNKNIIFKFLLLILITTTTTVISTLSSSSSSSSNNESEIIEIIDSQENPQYQYDMDSLYQTYLIQQQQQQQQRYNINTNNTKNITSLSSSSSSFNNNNNNNNSSNINNNNNNMLAEFYNSKDNRNLQYLLIKLYNDIKFWRNLFIIVGAIITICGCTLNTLCIFIFYRSNLFHNSSFPYYVYVLSIVDSLCLIIRYVVPQASETLISSILLNRYNATNDAQYEVYTDQIVSEYHCNIIMYIHNTLGFASTWIMAAISIERWLVIKYPLQTKSLIRFRAYLILSIIIVVVFVINLFDFAPNFYNKPHWFSNLTLLCEPFDSIQHVSLGNLKLNADAYSFVRILLQAVGPFVVALLFNSLIIHNFKRIKSAAYRIKSTSSISVMVSPSHSSHCFNNTNNTNNGNSKQASPIFKHYSSKKRKASCVFIDDQQIDGNHLYSTRPSQASLTTTPNNIADQQQRIESQYGSTLMPPTHDSTTNINNTGTNHQVTAPAASATVSTTKYSFKRRLSKLRLHRETDVMLIVLSFSILITQLPCTITWYLIYYRLLLTHINDMYLAARSPILIYILRLIEMLYFSMNFIFYITLSPSLRKELKLDPLKHIRKLFSKNEKDKQLNHSNSTINGVSNNKVKNIIVYDKSKKMSNKSNKLTSYFNLFKKNHRKTTKVYKIRKSNDIKIVIDNYENSNNNTAKLLNTQASTNGGIVVVDGEDIQMKLTNLNIYIDDDTEK